MVTKKDLHPSDTLGTTTFLQHWARPRWIFPRHTAQIWSMEGSSSFFGYLSCYIIFSQENNSLHKVSSPERFFSHFKIKAMQDAQFPVPSADSLVTVSWLSLLCGHMVGVTQHSFQDKLQHRHSTAWTVIWTTNPSVCSGPSFRVITSYPLIHMLFTFSKDHTNYRLYY